MDTHTFCVEYLESTGSNKEGGYYYDWHQVGPDHIQDCEVMQVVCASMPGFVGAESVEAEESSG